ncbi:MAG: cytochrome P450 [Solirubrobacterales bacterium]|nr:cytochrome P450 [Solirubrobacterales bacterium]
MTCRASRCSARAPLDLSNLPPGPRMPVALQTAMWVRGAQWTMGQCAGARQPFGAAARRPRASASAPPAAAGLPGERMSRYGELMSALAGREIDGWPPERPCGCGPRCRRSASRSSWACSASPTPVGAIGCASRCAGCSTCSPANTWIPFGGGVRRCLGAAFAQLELETVLRELVARVDIRPARRS